MLVILWRFCILYGYKNKYFRKTSCIVIRGMFSRDSACLILRRRLFSNNDRTFSISPSLIRGLPLPPLCAIFPAVTNFSCQCRMLFRVGGVLLIDVLIHLRVVVIEPVSMYFATMCAFSESVNAILRILFKTRYLDRTIFRTKEIWCKWLTEKHSFTIVKTRSRINYLFDDGINILMAHCIKLRKSCFSILGF